MEANVDQTIVSQTLLDGLLHPVCCTNDGSPGDIWHDKELTSFGSCADQDSVYIISLYQNLGLTGGVPLIIGAAYVTVATISNFVGALLLDRVGRKILFSELCS